MCILSSRLASSSLSLATFSAVKLVYSACWLLSSGSHPWPECRDKITRKVDSFDTSLALRVVHFLENDIQTTKADLDVKEEFPPALLSLGEMFNECNPSLESDFWKPINLHIGAMRQGT